MDTPFVRRYAVFSDTQQQALVNLFIVLTCANCGRAHLSAQGMCGVGEVIVGGGEHGLVLHPQETSFHPQVLALHGVGAKL